MTAVILGLIISLHGFAPQLVLSGGTARGVSQGVSTPKDLTSTAAEACGYDDDSSQFTPVDVGDNWFACAGLDADHGPYEATKAE